jgi:hypothetical protein
MGRSAGELMAMERFFIFFYFSFFLITSSLATIDQHHTPLTLKGYYYFLFNLLTCISSSLVISYRFLGFLAFFNSN